MAAIAAQIHKREQEHAALLRYHEQEVAMQRNSDGSVSDDSFTLKGEDFLDSDEEEDDDDDDDDGDEDYTMDKEEIEDDS